MQYQENDFPEAFSIFMNLLKNKGVLSRKNKEFLQSFRRSEIQEIIQDTIQPIANVHIFQTDDKTIQMVPNFDNQILGYNNQRLREEMKLEDNKQLYLACFIIIITISKFYNSESQFLATRAYVTVEEIEKTVHSYIEDFLKQGPDEQKDFQNLSQMDFKGMVNIWFSLPVYNEKSKTIERTKNNRISFILRALRFMQDKDLFILHESKEIQLTEKLKQIIEHYYFNEERKSLILQLFNK
jgi:hypothetical protein